MGKDGFVPRFKAWKDDQTIVEVDNRLARIEGGEICVAVKRQGKNTFRFFPLNDLKGVPLGHLAITRQLYGRRQFAGP